MADTRLGAPATAPATTRSDDALPWGGASLAARFPINAGLPPVVPAMTYSAAEFDRLLLALGQALGADGQWPYPINYLRFGEGMRQPVFAFPDQSFLCLDCDRRVVWVSTLPGLEPV